MSDDTPAGFRLSPRQACLWPFYSGEGADAFRAVALVEVRGKLDVATLERAVAAAVERHEILRTRLEPLPGLSVPVQVVHDSNEMPIRVSVDETTDSAALLSAARVGGLDPRSGTPVVRWAPSEPERGMLVLALPASFADTESLKNLIREIAAGCTGSALEAEPLQYADVAEWQHGLLEDAAGPFGDFWSADAPVLRIPPGNALDGGGAGPGIACTDHRLPDTLRGSLEAIALDHRSEFPELLLAAWQVVLGRITGSVSFTTGMNGDGRAHDEIRNALGRFARDLPLPCALAREESFLNHLTRSRNAARALLEKQDYFDWPGSGQERPWFPICFAVEDHRLQVDEDDRTWKLHALECNSLPYQMRLTAVRDTSGWRLVWRWDPASHTRADVEIWHDQLVTLLEEIARRPHAVLSELNSLPASLQKWLLEDLNDTSAPWPQGRRIEELWIEQVRRTPDAPAVIAEGSLLSYHELWARSTGLAQQLRELGAGPDSPVGICVERSPEMLVAIYGTLLAGAPYVPLDPHYPVERLEFMVTESGARVVVSHGDVGAELPATRVPLERVEPSLANLDSAPKITAMTGTAEDPAYLIFTSGSTGQPKGVAVRHRNLVHSTHARVLRYERGAERFLLLSSFSFDSSIAGIFWTSTTGGALVLPEPGAERDPAEIARLVETQRVTTLLCLPSMWSLVLAQTDPAALASLRTVIVAGEACTRDLVDTHLSALPNAELWNEYGPTEASVWCTVHACRAGTGERVPIGRPIANTRVYVLDERRRPVPPGAPGELYVGGEGVVAGYWKKPELTEERFFPDPFRPGADSRMYRTGDRASWRLNGELDFLGRVDGQVKIRGHRIELDEIAMALSQHPKVHDATVIAGFEAGQDSSPEGRLIAYVVLKTPAPSIMDLRAYLNRSLPDFMVPASWIDLPELPRLPNGKVDRAALPTPDSSRPEVGTTYIAPRNPLEEVLSGLCAEVLGLDRVGIEDGFFDLGGNSLLVTRFVTLIRENLSTELPLRAVFETPTVAALAHRLSEGADAERVTRAAELLLGLLRESDAEIARRLAERGRNPSGA